jgi:hypothetical protein
MSSSTKPDQSLGRRDSGSNDAGIGGRIYGMIAEEMSKSSNRGHIVWVLASESPRPDRSRSQASRSHRCQNPAFSPPPAPPNPFISFALCANDAALKLRKAPLQSLETTLPLLLTPGAAEALSIKVYRLSRVEKIAPLEALKRCLADYQNPVPAEILAAQIELAVREASDLDFVPQALRVKS